MEKVRATFMSSLSPRELDACKICIDQIADQQYLGKSSHTPESLLARIFLCIIGTFQIGILHHLSKIMHRNLL